MKRTLLVLIVVFILLATPINSADSERALGNHISPREDIARPSANPGASADAGPYVVLEMSGGDITPRGDTWSLILNSSGIVSRVLDVNDIVGFPELLDRVPLILVDASVGSGDGAVIQQTVLDLLVQEDISLLLTGRSAWILHRLRKAGPPLAVPATMVLLESAEYAGAAFMTTPNTMTIGAPLTTETDLLLPDDIHQTEVSRLVDLTGASPSSVASLRFDSMPLDIFLYSPEDPSLLTSAGRNFLENTIAFASALRETDTATVLADQQAPAGSLLEGGFSFQHDPTIAATYYAVHSAKTLLSGAEWTDWVSQNAALVQSVLDSLTVDFGSETGFMTSVTEGTVNSMSTGQGLWLVSTMGLSAQFNTPEIVTYLSSQQDANGGFENGITSTYHVVEALYTSGNLGSIDSLNLENWLRSLVIDGGKTSNPDLWGAIGANPTSLAPTNDYALKYLRSLAFIGKAHPDPGKLTDWILTRTTLGGGSFRNSQNPDEEIVTGTSSALSSLHIMGTLSASNRTAGLVWLENNQLDSGGFGMKPKVSDLVGKTRETSRVALCLNLLSDTGNTIVSGIMTYLSTVRTDIGFEGMDPLPSLMWTSWLLSANRLSHSSGTVNIDLAEKYLSSYVKWTQYPIWDNITTLLAPEYLVNQYRTKSVWTQYFGTLATAALGLEFSPDVISEATLYLSQAQYVTGHYRPTSLMGTAHVQHSVAAIETLYMIGKLDTIPYRSALESAMLSEYSSGSWDSSGWTLAPFAGNQEAIDFLCTRAAVRLGIVTQVMASEIASTISSHIQYTDLLALSYSVASLSLLNASAFSVNLEPIDRSQVLSALRSSSFATGWYNSTSLWQPVFTESVLRMVSILGLRTSLRNIEGNKVTASAEPTVSLGSDLAINVSIRSSVGLHSVLVHAFDKWTRFENVASSDTLSLPAPSSADALGQSDVSVIVMDWGVSRAYETLTIVVDGEIAGQLSLDSSVVKMNEPVNGTIEWTLNGGIDAGQSHIIVRLGNSSTYQVWTYYETSPFLFSMPTTGFSAGVYNLTITVEKQFCSDLALQETIDIVEPNPTFITPPPNLSGTVDEALSIDWSLHHGGNSSQIEGQLVSLIIRNALNSTVFTDTEVSQIGGSTFSWTPTTRGDYTYTIVFPGNQSLESSQTAGTVTISEHTVITWIGTGTYDQFSTVSIDVLLETAGGEPLGGRTVHVTVTSPSLVVNFNADLVTNATGHVSLTLTLSENGIYSQNASFSDIGLLISSSSSDSIISWSASTLLIGGANTDESIGDSLSLWAELQDSISNPVEGQQITLRVILLPSTQLVEQTLVTDSSGIVTLAWTASSAGSYRFEAVFSGTASRGADLSQIAFDVLVPVTFNIVVGPSLEVSVLNWIEVTATDHLAAPISGLTFTLNVRGPGNELLLTGVFTTSSSPVSVPWTPSMRGQNRIDISSAEQNWYQESGASSLSDVFENASVSIALPERAVAPATRSIVITVVDTSFVPIESVSVHCQISLEGTLLYEGYQITPPDGTITLPTDLDDPGQLIVTATIAEQDWLLEISVQKSTTVFAATSIAVSTSGQPVAQGSTVGVVITLLDWGGSPLIGSQVQILVHWNNGTLLQSHSKITDGSGICTIAQQFPEVGDFIINATYFGYGLNSSASNSVPQRVFVTPNIVVAHDPSCIVGETFEIRIGLTSHLDEFIVGRTISIAIEQSSTTVFETQFQSANGLLSVFWDPAQGGLATITVLHEGNIYYLRNLTTSVASVMEHVTADLWFTPSQVNLFESTTLVYNLTSGLRVGITISFEVLGMDLVPVWSQEVVTNESGIAAVVYDAMHCHGVLRVNAGPVADQFLIGGDKQKLLIVMTECVVATGFESTPPRVDSLSNITIQLIDELGVPIDGLTVTVSLFDPYSEQVKLGYFTMSVSLTVVDGLAFVEFTPEMVGLYTVVVTSSGATSIHSFTETDYHTVYSGTQLDTVVSTHELEVGETLSVTSRLTDHAGNPLVGRNLTLTADGPGANFIGPLELITDATGYIEWSSALADEGLWVLDISFTGLGVYLPVDTSDNINVRYGTVVDLVLIDTGDVIAGVSPASFSVLLSDSGGTPLEGFTVHYQAYHETLGLVLEGNIIQAGTDPMVLNLMFDMMGNYTVLALFTGTSHYHASNVAVQLWVMGTTEVSVDIPQSVDRSTDTTIPILFTDEKSLPLQLSGLSIEIALLGPFGPVNLTQHLSWNLTTIDLITFGLPVGAYALNITAETSTTRVGIVSITEFSIMSTTQIELTQESLTGMVSEQHSFVLGLRDSLSELVGDADIWVSVYNPSNREIFGSPLTEKTLLHVGSAVSWLPTIVGEYRVFLEFEGNAFLNSSTLEFRILIRYPSSITLEMPEFMEYGNVVPITATLRGALGSISGAVLTLTVSSYGVETRVETLTTGSRGIATVNLASLLSGTHTITVEYGGSSTQASFETQLDIKIIPLVMISVEPVSEMYVGHYCSVNLSVSVLGTTSNWTGTIDAKMYDPDGKQVTEWNFGVGVHTILKLGFNAQKVGTHSLNVTLNGLPIIVSKEYPLAVVIVDESLQLELDAGTTPLLGGFSIITIIGIALRKKLKDVLESLPGDWSD